MYLGPDQLLVAAKVAVTPTDSAAAVAEAIDQAERGIRDALAVTTVIYLEPDIARAGTLNA
jgi:hypothetical protein